VWHIDLEKAKVFSPDAEAARGPDELAAL